MNAIVSVFGVLCAPLDDEVLDFSFTHINQHPSSLFVSTLLTCLVGEVDTYRRNSPPLCSNRVQPL